MQYQVRTLDNHSSPSCPRFSYRDSGWRRPWRLSGLDANARDLGTWTAFMFEPRTMSCAQCIFDGDSIPSFAALSVRREQLTAVDFAQGENGRTYGSRPAVLNRSLEDPA
jgi:hypothetical protein